MFFFQKDSKVANKYIYNLLRNEKTEGMGNIFVLKLDPISISKCKLGSFLKLSIAWNAPFTVFRQLRKWMYNPSIQKLINFDYQEGTESDHDSKVENFVHFLRIWDCPRNANGIATLVGYSECLKQIVGRSLFSCHIGYP